MKSLKNRVRRIERFLDAKESVTIEGVELILSVMPPEIAEAVRRKLSERAEQTRDDDMVYQAIGRRGGKGAWRSLYGKKINLLLDDLPQEWADKAREKMAQRKT
jgi:hypothetical protein